MVFRNGEWTSPVRPPGWGYFSRYIRVNNPTVSFSTWHITVVYLLLIITLQSLYERRHSNLEKTELVFFTTALWNIPGKWLLLSWMGSENRRQISFLCGTKFLRHIVQKRLLRANSYGSEFIYYHFSSISQQCTPQTLLPEGFNFKLFGNLVGFKRRLIS